MSKLKITQLEYYHSLGWALIPLSRESKGAAVKWKEIYTAPSIEVVMDWHGQFRNHNWAVILGPSKLIVLDLDDIEAFKKYLHDFEMPFPKTTIVKSPGGAHLYFHQGADDVDRTVPKPFGFAGEYRAGRGIVVLPLFGNGYTWLRVPAEMTFVPNWMKSLMKARIAPRPTLPQSEPRKPGVVSRWMETGFNPNPPERHVYLLSIARAMIDDGLGIADRLDVLEGVNRNFTKGPKDDEEIQRIAVWTP